MKVPMNGLLVYEAQVASVFIRTLPEKGALVLYLTKLPKKKEEQVARQKSRRPSCQKKEEEQVARKKKKSRSADGTTLSRPGMTNTHHSFQQSNHSSHKSSLLILS